MSSIQAMVVGPVQTNVYFLINDETKECVLIDPAENGALLLDQIISQELTLTAILLTHGHFDHVGGVEQLRDLCAEKGWKVPVYAMEAEAPLLADASLNHSAFHGGLIELQADVLLRDGERFFLAGIPILAIHTPGHTRGGGCYYLEEEGVLFSGDTLFAQSVGRSDLPTGDGAALISSIKEKLLVLPDQTKVLPGHGGFTTIGEEKRYNPFL